MEQPNILDLLKEKKLYKHIQLLRYYKKSLRTKFKVSIFDLELIENREKYPIRFTDK